MATRLILAGGFLGAGKTTLLLQAARRLSGQGHRVGLITNDQGDDLVDTALAGQRNIPVSEVAGGCFCCRFPDLIKAAGRLREAVDPDVILAEPVGSCTDLMATVVLPLARHYGHLFHLAPLSIVLDATRNLSSFPATVHYLYRQQLAEAEIIVLNKSDRLEARQWQSRLADLRATYPEAQILGLSARTGDGVADWLAAVTARPTAATRVLESLDYATYADAEANLGWLNAKGALRADAPFSARNWLANLLQTLDSELAGQGAPVAHVKVHVDTPAAALKASLTELGQPISWDSRPEEGETDRAQFILNARVNTDPRTLEAAVRQAIAASSLPGKLRCDYTHFECFRPTPPRPTHRMEA